MTDVYEYIDIEGDRLAVVPNDTGTVPAVILRAAPGVRVTAADVPSVINGIIARLAAAQGREAGRDPLAHIARDLDVATRARDAHGTFAQVGVDAAICRVIEEHLPLLYALAAAYLGDDAPIWNELRRTQRERDDAAAAASAADRRCREMETRSMNNRTEAERWRGELAEARAEAARFTHERDEARAEAEQLRAETKTLNAAVDQAGRGGALALRHFRQQAANAELRTALGEVLGALGVNGARSFTPDDVRRWAAYGSLRPEQPRADVPLPGHRVTAEWLEKAREADKDTP